MIVANRSKTGYIQMVDTGTNEIKEQRVGCLSDIQYHEEKVWFVKPGFKVVFSEKSELSQPYKFFRPVPKTTVIKVFKDNLDTSMPNESPTWVGSALELERMKFSAHSVAGNIWNAFTPDGEWVGTSEY